MPFTVHQLIEGRPRPVTVSPEEPVQRALELMVEHDFSQLPVVDMQGTVKGMVTSDSILRALSNFNAPLDSLRVSHATVRAEIFRSDEDLFELLDDLLDASAVLIVDGDRKLIGILTSYDTTKYFRRRAEDMMLVEDIENMVKDRILSAFTNETGELDAAGLELAIADVTDSRTEQIKKFVQAVRKYLQLAGDANAKVSPEKAEEAYSLVYGRDTTKTFEQLSLYDYTALLLHKSQWARLEPVFALEPGAVRTLLSNVRQTRNSLAHFHGEISARQRDQLRFASEWLANAQLPAPSLPAREVTEADLQQIEAMHAQEQGASSFTEDGGGGSRYARLAFFLQEQPEGWDMLQLTFDNIEAIIDDRLPPSAREHRAWWANEQAHVQAQQWMRVGWRTTNIDMSEGRVVFKRSADGQ